MTKQSIDNTSRDQFGVRCGKRAAMLEQGKLPYQTTAENSPASINSLFSSHDFSLLQPNERFDETVSVAGRIMRFRCSGKISFAVLRDGRGGSNQIQLLVSRGTVGDESYAAWKKTDLGDHVVAGGRLGLSSSGEPSLFVESWHMTSKTLRPMPNLEHEVSASSRFRRRYLDLMVSEEARDLMLFRSKMVREIRSTLEEREFVEVETPILQTERGGANARPFATRSNALGVDLYLRIATELYLKRAVVGGFDRVFEIGKDFRNEGVDATHSPEFTMLEAYEAYGDFESAMQLTESLCRRAAFLASSDFGYSTRAGESMLAKKPWARVDLFDSLSEALGFQLSPQSSLQQLQTLCEQYVVEFSRHDSRGKLIEELWEELVLPTLGDAPVFVVGFPQSSSPLAAEFPDRSEVVQKWDLYVGGVELATGYSELVDPVVQRQRLESQLQLASLGDQEAMSMSEDFLLALEHGAPPMDGIGLGVDRLVSLLTGANVRESIMFPLVRPLESSEDAGSPESTGSRGVAGG